MLQHQSYGCGGYVFTRRSSSTIRQSITVWKAKRPLLRRVDTIHREVKAGHYPSARQLARINETSEKTVLEDIEYMKSERGAPLEYSAKCRGWYYTSETYELPRLEITEGELVALFLADQLLRQHQGLPYEAELTRAVQKLIDMLPDEVSIQPQTVAHTHSFRTSVVSLRDVEIFRQLADAALKRRQLQITYYTASRDSESSRIVDPVHLTCVDGEWYLVGYCHTRRDRRMFSPGRIRKLATTGQTFAPHDDFQIGDFLGETFRLIREDSQPLQQIRLRFAPSAAKYIREKIWHASQQLLLCPDGGVELSLSLRSMIEIRRWILSWGAECEVLEPANLRADISQEARGMASRYEHPPAPRKKPPTLARDRTRGRA